MALRPGTRIEDIKIDRVFIGSCTNSRITDLKVAAGIVKGKHVAKSVHAMVVPGSQQVKAETVPPPLHRPPPPPPLPSPESGCSMCLAMNPDVLQPGERCASTSNLNFVGS